MPYLEGEPSFYRSPPAVPSQVLNQSMSLALASLVPGGLSFLSSTAFLPYGHSAASSLTASFPPSTEFGKQHLPPLSDNRKHQLQTERINKVITKKSKPSSSFTVDELLKDRRSPDTNAKFPVIISSLYGNSSCVGELYDEYRKQKAADDSSKQEQHEGCNKFCNREAAETIQVKALKTNSGSRPTTPIKCYCDSKKETDSFVLKTEKSNIYLKRKSSDLLVRFDDDQSTYSNRFFKHDPDDEIGEHSGSKNILIQKSANVKNVEEHLDIKSEINEMQDNINEENKNENNLIGKKSVFNSSVIATPERLLLPVSKNYVQ